MWAVAGPVAESELRIFHVAKVFVGSIDIGVLLCPYSNEI